jgi:transcriptional regulator of acetoin/glycerol metabolism
VNDRLIQARGKLRSLKERASEPGAIASDGLPVEIQRSWSRCAQQGVSLIGSRDPDRLSARELKERAERFERLVGGAAPIMHNLSRQISNTRSMVILSDPEGLILHCVGDDDFVSRAERVALQPGVSWNEASKGTNAIGTAAVERAAVVVHAGEHYVERNQFLTCSASPIFDGFGEVAGVLDISGDCRSYQDHTLALVRLGAQMIEERLFDEAARGYHIVRFHPQRAFLFSIAEGRAAFSDAGLLIAANHAGRQLLGAPAGGEDFDRLFGFPWEQALSRCGAGLSSVLACNLPRGTPIALALTLGPSNARGRQPTAAAAVRVSAPSLGSAHRGGTPLRPTPAEIGRNDERMGQAVDRARRVMHSGIPLLIQGESGTGKEWLARSLHEHGRRAGAAFVAVNCAAIPDALIESELFGYEEGAFTGARRRGSPGRIREADGGTLFLDEIGDMPLNLQARLLRVLQDRAVTPLGSGRSYPVDINVVCATHRRLRDLVAAGTFREDLYYRLNGFTVGLPPLRERADLEPLVRSLLSEECPSMQPPEVCGEAMALFLRHPWPGNIRQLRNVIRTGLALMEEGQLLDVGCLADDFLEEAEGQAAPGDSLATPHAPPCSDPLADLAPRQAPATRKRLQEMEWLTIQDALQRLDGNVSAAARELGISRNRLYRKLREFA